jgi:hypothetical protein
MPDLDDVMQAAERVRQSPKGYHDIRELNDDVNELADFALSILPKGKRPEPVEQPDGRIQVGGAKNPAWFVNAFGMPEQAECCCTGCYPPSKGVTFYATKADAKWIAAEQALEHLAACAKPDG